MNKMYRHGDVLLIKVDGLPDIPLKKKKGKVILEGEVTGHAHRLKGNAKILGIAQDIADKANEPIYVIDGEDIKGTGIIGYAVIDGDTDLVHEEHKTITLPTGIYQIRRQREYDENTIRFVQD